jgi:SAM-dependent methyltransferase
MIPYNKAPLSYINSIANFTSATDGNIDLKTVESFGREWNKYSTFTKKELEECGYLYFDIVPEEVLNSNSNVLDIGCGTGRWAKYLSNRVGFIEAVDPSNAVLPAKEFTAECENIRITKAGIDNIPFPDESFDFVFSLGVMHHLPDTEDAIKKAVSKLKKNGYLLLYLYYNLENRNKLFKFAFHIVDLLRRLISGLPFRIKITVCDLLTFVLYLPLVFIGTVVKNLFPGKDFYKKIPLSFYIGKSLRIIRNDALDRFGTPVEKRFSKSEIETMVKRAGLIDIIFSEQEPYWHLIGKKAE